MIRIADKTNYTKLTQDIVDILESALAAVEPEHLVSSYLHTHPFWKSQQHITVIGFGKASYQMAKATEYILGNRLKTGAVIVPRLPKKAILSKIKLLPGSHPLPTHRSLQSTKQLLRYLTGLQSSDMVICLISGGGSSLCTLPTPDISLNDLKKTFDMLIRHSAADIRKINTIRKHLSQVKGGRLALLCQPASIHTLIISDVAGNDLSSIASGPTAPDPSTFQQALHILTTYRLSHKIPTSVRSHLEKGQAGLIPETPDAGHPIFQSKKITNHIIGDNSLALRAAAKRAKCLGYQTVTLPNFLQGEVRTNAKEMSQLLTYIPDNTCVVAGGETTLHVTQKGHGGRNQEYALHLLRSLPTTLLKSITAATFATDGNDGFCPHAVAGAVINAQTKNNIKKSGLNIARYLSTNDSYTLLNRINAHLITGLTGTNVMDIVVAIKKSRQTNED